MGKLTDKQEIFVLNLFNGDSQRKAYRDAFPSSIKWKDKSVDEKASVLANSVKILSRLEELRTEAQERSQVTHQMITDELAKMAFFDIGEIFDDNGELKSVHNMSATARKVISSIKVKTETNRGSDESLSYITEVKLNDKGQSLDKLSKHIGYYEKDNSQKQDIIIIGKPKELE